MTASRLALVADDTRLAGQIQASLERAFGRRAAQTSLDAVRGRLTADDRVVLLLAAATPVESERVLRLVQEICLRRLPAVLFVVEAGTPAPGRGLAALDPYLAGRLRWPEDGPALLDHLRELLRVEHDLLDTYEETVEDVIARRLLVQTPSLVPLVDRIALAARHDVTVLLTGETGTGKTHIARLLHDCSERASQPFVHVPCGAVPANLVESTFFGHAKGAFTGAVDNKVGKFEAARDGTILLDEIDTLPLEQQASLLRVIETGEFEPVGSNETRYCQARILVASNWDLEQAVRQNRFRQDLYYRLNVMAFHLPALRERVQDIAPLARGMAARFTTRFKKDLFDISRPALDALEGHGWPGNIRQLENVVQQAVLVSSGRDLLHEHLPAQVREPQLGLPREALAPAAAAVPASPRDSLKHSREVTERQVIVRALSANGQNRSRTAAALGISRVTLYKKMRAYGLLDVETLSSGSPGREEQSGSANRY